jgi:hypothetical protein
MKKQEYLDSNGLKHKNTIITEFTGAVIPLFDLSNHHQPNCLNKEFSKEDYINFVIRHQKIKGKNHITL